MLVCYAVIGCWGVLFPAAKDAKIAKKGSKATGHKEAQEGQKDLRLFVFCAFLWLNMLASLGVLGVLSGQRIAASPCGLSRVFRF